MTTPTHVCTYCGNEAIEGDCPFCRAVPPKPEDDHDDDVAISKALADPRFDAEFDRIFGKGWR